MSKAERQIEQLIQIVKQHVFKDANFWRFKVGRVDGVLEIQIAPRHVETVQHGLADFFAAHGAHPLKAVPIEVKGSEAHEPTPPRYSGGRSLQLG